MKKNENASDRSLLARDPLVLGVRGVLQDGEGGIVSHTDQKVSRDMSIPQMKD